MMKKSYKIIDETGLHARPATLLVQEAAKFKNDIAIEYNGNLLTMKSIMAVLSLGVPQNATITIHVDGEDAEVVFAALEQILAKHQLI